MEDSNEIERIRRSVVSAMQLSTDSVTAAGADGDIIELAHCFPLLDASGTTL